MMITNLRAWRALHNNITSDRISYLTNYQAKEKCHTLFFFVMFLVGGFCNIDPERNYHLLSMNLINISPRCVGDCMHKYTNTKT